MFRNNTIIRRWHIVGFFWIIIVGSLLHFTYKWSNYSTFVGYFSSVNESIWEHLKLGYFSLTFFMLVEYWSLRNKTDTYFLAKFAGIVSMSIFIAVVSYMYKIIAENSNVYFHIGLFVMGALICQIVSMKVMKLSLNRKTNVYGLIIYIVMGALFIILTPYQINVFLFLK